MVGEYLQEEQVGHGVVILQKSFCIQISSNKLPEPISWSWKEFRKYITKKLLPSSLHPIIVIVVEIKHALLRLMNN
jgi:hypothetical protein